MAMKAITVNTAASAEAHITAEDDAAIYQSIFGGDGVMNIGSCMKATVLSNNKVRVADGVICVGGHIARMKYADYADMTIENGTSGKNRNDIIYAKFSTSPDVDTYTLEVKKGTAAATASDPAMTQGNIYQGSALREYPLWRVKLEGLSIVKVEQLFTVIPTIPELQEQLKSEIADVNGKLEIFSNAKYIQTDFDTYINEHANETFVYFGHSEKLSNSIGYWCNVLSFGTINFYAQLAIGQSGKCATRFYVTDTGWTDWHVF